MAAESSDEARNKSLILRFSLLKRKAAPLSHHDDEKRMKVDHSKHSTTTLMKNKIQERAQLADEKRRKVIAAAAGEDSRKSRTPSSPLVKSRKNDDDRMECNKKEKKNMMEQCKKNQCWLIVKRMIVGKDGWVLKKCIDLKGLDNYDQIKEEFKITTMRTIGLEDIEVKLNKYLYSGPDEFADDMRLVFSRAFLYPPRTEIHRIAKRLSESFENNWKSLKEERRLEDINRRMKRVHKGSNCK